MGSVVNAGQVLEVKVGIDLGGRDVGVPEQLLHAAQLATRLEQVRGKGMAEEMRVDVPPESLAARPERHACLDGARSEPPAGAADEQRGLDRGGEGGGLAP